MRCRAIIPAAGLGTRMNMSHNQSKELLIDPVTGQPLIQWHLSYCQENSLEPLVITRKEKTDLIEYCELHSVEYMVIEPEGEWPNTIAKSSSYWLDYNIVLLPDAKFVAPKFIEHSKLLMNTQDKSFVFGVQEVLDPKNWCIIKDGLVFEKRHGAGQELAIVLFAFSGIRPAITFFSELNIYKCSDKAVNNSLLFVEEFHDLTRTGVVSSIDLSSKQR